VRLGLADKYGVICVAPTFSQLPWYADHPTNVKLSQERHLLEVVVPAIERLYSTVEQRDGRLLVGFSKSGWGALSLLLRHPDVFGRAAAWDSPLTMDWPSKYGSREIFGTPENFAEYRILPLFERRAAPLKKSTRVVLAGHGNFRAEMEAAHRKLEELGIPHKYLDGPVRKHDWHSGWLADVCEVFLGNP
jgi:enterochelin esterase-like enzyme